MIPAAGRDVQCSNCSSTWFQPGPRPPAPPVPEEPFVETAAAPTLAEVTIDAPDDAAGQRPTRRQIDPGVAEILREEAEREARLRRGDAQLHPIETQGEMPLDSAQDSARSRRLADLDETAEDAFDADDVKAAVAGATLGSRRELFPDIEEINSTLRATDDRSAAEGDASDYDTLGSVPQRRRRVRIGFFLVIAIALIGLGLYVYAAEIRQMVPQAGPALDSFVAVVDQARLWLDGLARSLASGISG